MPLERYAVLRGQPIDTRVESTDQTPHYHLRLGAGKTHFRVSVSVQSSDQSALLYAGLEHLERLGHPLLPALGTLAPGVHPARANNGLAIDYVRSGLVEQRALRVVPAFEAGALNDLNDFLNQFVYRAMNEPGGTVYAFGQAWGPEPRPRDQVFGFRPGNGIHDIHLNQGNSPGHRAEDGVWQDGALLFHYPAAAEWVGLFLAFQSQSWATDPRTGHALPTR